MDVLVFRSGEAKWGIEISRVREILDTTIVIPLPELPVWMTGLMDHRGTLVPVVDFRILSGDEPMGRNATLVIAAGERDLAITVDGVESTESIDPSTLLPDPDRPWTVGVSGEIAILDPTTLLEVRQ